MHAMTLLSAAYRLLGSLGQICLMLMDSKWQAAQQIYVAVKELNGLQQLQQSALTLEQPLEFAVQLATLHPSSYVENIMHHRRNFCELFDVCRHQRQDSSAGILQSFHWRGSIRHLSRAGHLNRAGHLHRAGHLNRAGHVSRAGHSRGCPSQAGHHSLRARLHSQPRLPHGSHWGCHRWHCRPSR